MTDRAFWIHESADVDSEAQIGIGTKVWHRVHIREGVIIGDDCTIGKDVYIDHHVKIGSRCKIQNGAQLYFGLTILDDVFVGPGVTFTNDLFPRAFAAEWEVTQTVVLTGASIGANSTIVCGVTIGEYALVGAGSVITSDIEPFALVVGNPARQIGVVNVQGKRLK